ncbi:hypothetical protein HS7_00570 [Sulfolobales archaeon HS-7]|nr:hypothetical protein HS7_00570 [Sulfolobales archaeon HS-7]
MQLTSKEKIINSNKDLNTIVVQFSQYLQQSGWKVQNRVEGNVAIIQAQEGGILRDIIAADRALTFRLEKVPEGIKVHVGIGKWIQNLAVTAIEAIVLSWLFLAVDVPEMVWTEHVESKLVKKLEEIANT